MHTESDIRRVILVVVFCVFVMLSQAAHGQVGLSLAPLRLELQMQPGSHTSGALMLSNAAPTPVRVRGGIRDFYIDEESTPQFEPVVESESALSCRTWLTANPMDPEMGASSGVPVRYTIRVPADAAEGSYHCALSYTTVPKLEQLEQSSLRMAVELVASFYVIVGHPQAQATVKSLTVLPPDEKTKRGWRAVVAVENTGKLHARPVGKVEVLGKDDAVVEQVDLPSVPTLPLRTQKYVLGLRTKLDDGTRYTVRTRVDVGNGELQEARVVLEPQS